MAKAKKKTAPKKESKEKGKQLDLIDVAPENSKALIAAGRRYRDALASRLKFGAEEKKFKQEILNLIVAAKLKPLKDGVIKFELDGLDFAITPRDMLVQVKEKTESE
jgi:hypothetical protein